MRKKISLLLKFGGILLLIVVGAVVLMMGFSAAMLAYDTHRYQEFHNPEQVPDLAHFLEHYGDPERMYLVRVDQNQFYELVAPKGDFNVLASGPPIFLYGQNGKLWDYTPDSGDVNFVKSGFQVGSIRRDEEVENPNQLIRKIIAEY